MGLWLRSYMAAVRGMGRFRAASVVQKGRERLSFSINEDINPKHEDMDSKHEDMDSFPEDRNPKDEDMDWFPEDIHPFPEDRNRVPEDIHCVPEDRNPVREDMNPRHEDMNCALEGTKTIPDEADALPHPRAAPAVERRGFPPRSQVALGNARVCEAALRVAGLDGRRDGHEKAQKGQKTWVG